MQGVGAEHKVASGTGEGTERRAKLAGHIVVPLAAKGIQGDESALAGDATCVLGESTEHGTPGQQGSREEIGKKRGAGEHLESSLLD